MGLGLYRKIVNDICRKRELKRIEFEILLFGFDYEYFNRRSLDANIPCSRSTLKLALSHLVNERYLKVIRERAHHKSRLYALSSKSKLMMNNFYKQINY